MTARGEAREIAHNIVKHCRKKFGRRGLYVRTDAGTKMGTGINVQEPQWAPVHGRYVLTVSGWENGAREWWLIVYITPALDVEFKNAEDVPTNVLDCVLEAGREAV